MKDSCRPGMEFQANNAFVKKDALKEMEELRIPNSSGYVGEPTPGDEARPASTDSFFNKDEGKLVYKVTRVNKQTHKEKLITKSRRIISKCPHTSMKYYAKGMCK